VVAFIYLPHDHITDDMVFNGPQYCGGIDISYTDT
jgi:hypothetical protein